MHIPIQGNRDHEEQKHEERNMAPPKEHIKLPVTNPREMEIHEFPDNELKTIVLKMLRELRENTYKQFDKIRKPMQDKMRSTKRKQT